MRCGNPFGIMDLQKNKGDYDVACPVANLTSVYAIQHDMEPALCARATLLSTILFAATIPFIIWLGQLVYGV